MSPDEFEAAMRDIPTEDTGKGEYVDIERAHIQADGLMCALLRQLGYRAGVEVFEQMDKWYA